jgi:protein-tyrosine phosphatase
VTARPPHDSYWVSPGEILAGPYPGDVTPEAAQAKVGDLLAAGVTLFVDLTEADEGLQPYAEHCDGARHVRHAIRDVDVPTHDEMRQILATIRTAVEAGETVYVHCWGGVGRTGTVVGCLLREDGLDAGETIARIRELRAMTDRAHRPSPETVMQCRFIAEWPVRRQDLGR